MNSHQRTPNTFKESFVVGNDSNASSIEAAAQVNSDANNLPLDLSFNLLPLDLSLKSIDREKKGDTCINVAADTTQATIMR